MRNSVSFLPPNLLLIKLIIIFIQIPSILTQKNNTEWYSNCTNLFSCGAIAINYPFWGGVRSAACGRPGLHLTCESKSPVIEIMSVKYRVLEINPSEQIIRIVRRDFAGNDICPDKFVNSTVDFSLFEYTSGYVNLTVQYGCPPLGINFPARLSCSVNGTTYDNGYVTPGAQGPGLCSASVFFPILNTIFGGILKIPDIGELVSSGFELRWKDDGEECTECQNSGGSCGFDVKLNQFTCLCSSGQIWDSSSCGTSVSVSSALINRPGRSFFICFG